MVIVSTLTESFTGLKRLLGWVSMKRSETRRDSPDSKVFEFIQRLSTVKSNRLGHQKMASCCRSEFTNQIQSYVTSHCILTASQVSPPPFIHIHTPGFLHRFRYSAFKILCYTVITIIIYTQYLYETQ